MTTQTTEQSDKTLERSIYLIAFIGSAVSLLIGVILYIAHAAKAAGETGAWAFAVHVGYMFATELGIAGFIALIIIATIEKFTRSKHEKAADRLIDRIKTDLFHAIYRRHIPTEVFEEIERCLLTKNVVRRNYDVNYSLRTIPEAEIGPGKISKADAENHLLCTVTARYELHNISDGTAKAPIELFLELPIDSNLRTFVKIEELKIDNSVTQINKKDSETHVGSSNEVTLSPHGSCKVSIRGRTVKRKTDMEVWATRMPCDGIRLQVVAPASIQVNANANHSCALDYERLDDQTQVWELDRGIFPFQSIIFWWHADPK